METTQDKIRNLLSAPLNLAQMVNSYHLASSHLKNAAGISQTSIAKIVELLDELEDGRY